MLLSDLKNHILENSIYKTNIYWYDYKILLNYEDCLDIIAQDLNINVENITDYFQKVGHFNNMRTKTEDYVINFSSNINNKTYNLSFEIINNVYNYRYKGPKVEKDYCQIVKNRYGNLIYSKVFTENELIIKDILE